MASLLAPLPLDDVTVNDLDDHDADDNGTAQQDKWQQEKLLRSIARLDKPVLSQRKIQRSEPARVIGDQNISVGSQRSLSVSALLKKFDNSESDKTIKKKQLDKKQSNVLTEPLRKTDAVKLQRTVAYEEVSKDIKKWDPIVKANRVGEGISFPLDQTKLQIQTTSEYVKRYQTRTPLEQEIDALLNNSPNNFTKATILTETEREALSAMSIQEAEFRRQELQKTRALLSYKEQKSRWQSKIKSKGYHRHLRRAKRKIDEKEFEELQKTNPDAALDKLEGLDKQRIRERLTLKHRSMGKWARHTASRSKTDKNARESLQEQLRLSRSLAEKLTPVESDSEELMDTANPEIVVNEQAFDEEAKVNPWMSSATAASDWEEESLDGAFEGLENLDKAKKLEAKKPVRKTAPKPLANRSRPQPKTSRRLESSESADDSPAEEVTELTEDGEMVLSTPNVQSGAPVGISQQHQKVSITNGNVCDLVNPDTAAQAKIHKTVVADPDEDVEVEDDSDSEQRNIVAQAFADDDVVEEFSREKDTVAEKDRPKDIDLSLPGWGDWAGAGIGQNLAKKRKFTVKAPAARPRKDRFLPNVIISERHDEKIVPHQIRELPFPFTTVDQLQSTIRAPVGKMWNTESAFDELTKPKFTTKMGTVIQPINPKLVLRKAKRKAREFFGEEVVSELEKSGMKVAGKDKVASGGSCNAGKKRTKK